MKSISGIGVAVAALALAGVAGPARAESSWGITPLAGQTLLDAELADFRWDTSPRAHWGGELWGRRGAWMAALQFRRGSSRQSTGLEDVAALDVDLRSLAASVRWMPLRWKGLEPFAGVEAGRLHLRWSPDRLEVVPTGGGTPVTVDFESLDRWQLGLHLGSQWHLHPRTALQLRVGYDRFTLPTAHRRGDEIVEETRAFGSWNWSLAVAFSPALFE